MQALNNEFHWNYFNLQPNSSVAQHLQQTFPFFFDLNQLTYSIEKELLILELDEREIALILALLIVSIGLSMNFEKTNVIFLVNFLANSKFKEIEKIEKLQEDMFCLLYEYMSGKMSCIFLSFKFFFAALF